jgi:KDO2-lipid IV(A) lauroyltransferase
LFKRLKNAVIYLAARMLMGFVRCLGWNASLRFGRWAGRRAYNRARKARETVLQNLVPAYPGMPPDEREALARAVFEHFGMAAAECINIRKLKDLTAYVEMEPASRKVMDDVLSRGRGVVYATAHCGNWELMARALARYGYPVNTIGRQSYDKRFTRLIDRFRREGAVNTLWRGEPDLLDRIVVQEYLPSDQPDLEQAVLEDTRELTARIEAHVRKHPAEWVWMHRRWKTRPESSTQSPG